MSAAAYYLGLVVAWIVLGAFAAIVIGRGLADTHPVGELVDPPEEQKRPSALHPLVTGSAGEGRMVKNHNRSNTDAR